MVAANHNPLLGRHKLEGEALSRFIIKSLPESLEQSKAAFLSELKRDKRQGLGAWAADYHAVLEVGPTSPVCVCKIPHAPERGVGRPPRNGPPPSEHEV
eukprot:scaffold1252_cov124-Isochrysis_galbana.AAC.3